MSRRGRPRHPSLLTPGEQRVLKELREGGTNAEIAAKLGLSPETVKTHIASMLSKLDLGDRRELAAWQSREAGARRRILGVLAVPSGFGLLKAPLIWAGAVLAGATVIAIAAIFIAAMFATGDHSVEVPLDHDLTAEATPPAPQATPTPLAPQATPTPAPAASPAGAVTVSGPLVVFSDMVGPRQRRVYVLDMDSGKYWVAFDYEADYSPFIETAGVSLFFRHNSRGLNRIGLNGEIEKVLFEGDSFSWDVSPNGRRVAVMDYDSVPVGMLRVLDAVSGAQLWPSDGAAPTDALLAELEGRGVRSLKLAGNALDGNSWSADGNSLAVAAYGAWAQDEEPVLGFDVISLETGAVRQVRAREGFAILLYGWKASNEFAWVDYTRDWAAGGSCETATVTAAESGVGQPNSSGCALAALESWEQSTTDAPLDSRVEGPYLLDPASGDIREPSRDEWRVPQEESRLTRVVTHGRPGDFLFYQDLALPVWEGNSLSLYGVIDLEQPLTLHDVRTLESPSPRQYSPPPRRDEMVGPLLAWSEWAGHGTELTDEGEKGVHTLRRVMLYDQGTGRTWKALDYSDRALPDSLPTLRGLPGYLSRILVNGDAFLVYERNGLRYVTVDGHVEAVLDSELLEDAQVLPDGGGVYWSLFASTDDDKPYYEAPDGQTASIGDGRMAKIGVSPSGASVTVLLDAPDLSYVTLLILERQTGEELLRVRSSDLRFSELFSAPQNLVEPRDNPVPQAMVTRRWSHDEDAVSIVYSTAGSYEPAGVLTLGGEFHPLPAGVWERALAPGLRLFVHWRPEQDEQGHTVWSFDIVELHGSRTLYTVAAQDGNGSPAGDWTAVDWEWADASTFAWSPANGFSFYPFRRGWEQRPPLDEIKVLNIMTGEIEILTAKAYSERFATAGASVTCPEDTVQPCSVLLGGEIVGQGRWATIIGTIDLE